MLISRVELNKKNSHLNNAYICRKILLDFLPCWLDNQPRNGKSLEKRMQNHGSTIWIKIINQFRVSLRTTKSSWSVHITGINLNITKNQQMVQMMSNHYLRITYPFLKNTNMTLLSIDYLEVQWSNGASIKTTSTP